MYVEDKLRADEVMKVPKILKDQLLRDRADFRHWDPILLVLHRKLALKLLLLPP